MVRFADRDQPPDLPGARGPRRRHRLSERHLDLAPGRGAGGLPAHHPRPRAGGDQALRLRDRVRLRRSARADADAGGQAAAGPVISPARSTAPPATRRRAPRAWSPASTPRCAAGGREPRLRRLARRGLYRRDDRRPGHPRRHRALSHVHLARRVPPAAARRQRRPAPDAARASRWAASAPSAQRGLRAPRRAALADGRARCCDAPDADARPRPPAPASTVNADGHRRSAFELLAYPGHRASRDLRGDLAADRPHRPAASREQIEIDARYAGYLDRQDADVEAFRRDEALAPPRRLRLRRDRRPLQRGAPEARPPCGPPPWARPPASKASPRAR